MPVTMRSLSRKPRPQMRPEADPRFRKVADDLKRKAAKVKQHPSPAKKKQEAMAAAKGPPNEKASGAKANQVDKIQGAPTGKPQPASFLELLQAEIAKAMPKTLGDTEKFMKGGSKEQLKGGLKGNVNEQERQASGGVEEASKEQPKQAGVPTTPGGTIPSEPAPPPPNIDGAAAMPAPRPEGDVSLQDSKQDTEAAMADAEVTPTQLKKANDPRFSAVLTAKDAVGKQADTAPAQFRARESGAIAAAGSQASNAAKKGATLMLGVKGKSKSAVRARQEAAKAQDEKERLKVASDIENMYAETKASVEGKLDKLEEAVNKMFDAGVDAALARMTAYVEDKIFDYKLRRYLSIPVVGQARWVRDQFKGLPEEANAFYVAGRNLFQSMMNALVVRVAALVERTLADAKAEVARGQAKIKKYVAGLKPSLRALGESKQKEYADKFKELEQGIEDRKNQLAQALAAKYKEAFDKADKALKDIQDANKGLVAAFVEKLGEIIKILSEFKSKLMALLKKGADAIKLILADPIGFLSNLIGAIKLGFSQFKANIGSWLIKGLTSWLFGALAAAGVTAPADFSLPSILKLVMQILGITYDRMRAKAVKLLGPTAVGIIEKLVDYLKTLIGGGPAALWEQVKGDLASLKDRILGDIKNMVIEAVVKAAVTKLLSMFNPAGAIVQAILAIYNTVMFVIEQAAQIMAFVEAIINSVMAIAQGAIGAAASKVEQALGAAIPLVIGFLARLLGLGDLPKRVTGIIKKVQGFVDSAIDKLLKKAVAFVKKMFGKLTGKGKKDERTEAQKKKALKDALSSATKLLKQRGTSHQKVSKGLPKIKSQYKLTSLDLVVVKTENNKETAYVRGIVNPEDKSPESDIPATEPDPSRQPEIEVEGFDIYAKDPAADKKQTVGIASWSEGTAVVTLAIYPMDAKIGGQPVTEQTRMRGGIIYNALFDRLEATFKQMIADATTKGQGSEAAKKYTIKGVEGSWNPTSDNTKTFNAVYKKKGTTLEAAAWKTFTGIMTARRFKFTKVTIKDTTPKWDDPSVEKRRELGFTNISCVFHN